MKDPEANREDLPGSAQLKTSTLTIKQKAGDAANQWLARNRSLVLRQTPVWAQALVGLMIGLGTITVIGGIFFRIDEVVTAPGQLKSIGGTSEVQSPVGGLVDQVFFVDGQEVVKGDLLLKFDTRKASDQKFTYLGLIKLEKGELKNQLEKLNSQLISLKSRQDVLLRKLDTKQVIIKELKKLVEAGGFQRLQYLEQKDQILEIKQQINDIAEQENRLNLQSDQLSLTSNKSIDRMEASLKEVEIQLQYQTVRAPADGIVFDSQARPNSVMQAGARIMSIVPQKGFYAEVFVPNQDIGFIKQGQSAKIRVDAFPFTRYGELTGSVSSIGADALPPKASMNYYRFPVNINLEKNFLESRGIRIPLKSGMSITTNLKLRDKRVISLLSDLLVDQTDSIRSLRQQ